MVGAPLLTRLKVATHHFELDARLAAGENADACPELTRRVRVDTEQRLRASAYAASCDEAAEHPACHLARRDWDLRVVPGGPTQVGLVLDGHD